MLHIYSISQIDITKEWSFESLSIGMCIYIVEAILPSDLKE